MNTKSLFNLSKCPFLVANCSYWKTNVESFTQQELLKYRVTHKIIQCRGEPGDKIKTFSKTFILIIAASTIKETRSFSD